MNVKASFALLLLIASTGPMAAMYRSPKEIRRDGIGGRLKKVIVSCLEDPRLFDLIEVQKGSLDCIEEYK